VSESCIVCGAEVPKAEQATHLRYAHPGPFYFWHDARRFATASPSMLVGELKQLVGCTVTYPFHEERDGKEIYYSDGQAVDLTREPHFFSVPPATY
jgi:hypothetical protein